MSSSRQTQSIAMLRDKNRKVAHPMEYLDMMYAFTNDSRYEKIAENLQENGKESEEIDMCIMLVESGIMRQNLK